MSVNVNRSVSDQFYRYKMPRLIAKVVALLSLKFKNSSSLKFLELWVNWA